MRTSLSLVVLSVHHQGSDKHVYVEVVLKGNEEGKFLEDPGAGHKETMENVLKLGRFGDLQPNEKLIVPLIEISSPLDPRRDRCQGEGNPPRGERPDHQGRHC